MANETNMAKLAAAGFELVYEPDRSAGAGWAKVLKDPAQRPSNGARCTKMTSSSQNA